MDALCLDCSATLTLDGDQQRTRCTNCHSRRLVAHDELWSLTIAHIDCDAFYAAVEKRDNPDVRDKPLIIGGTGRRGVVSTACYIARMSGVHSAMPMYKARRLCPDAVVIAPRMDAYRAVSRAVRAAFDRLTPSVEPLSIDEAFLDLSGTERLHGAPPAVMLARLVRSIEQDIGITVSVGLSHNKFLAKLASDLNKPRGFSVIGIAETLSRLAPMPIAKIYGVGKASQKALRKDGLTTIGQLQDMDETLLVKRYGSTGLRLARLSRGVDDRSIKTTRIAKSVSSERTLQSDVRDYSDLETELWRACEQVSHDLKAKGMAGRTLTLKLKTSGHRIITRSRTLASPTQLAVRIFDTLTPVLAAECGGLAYRLIGAGAGNLEPAKQADGFDLAAPERQKSQKVEHAMDALRAKFGTDSIKKGRTYRGKT